MKVIEIAQRSFPFAVGVLLAASSASAETADANSGAARPPPARTVADATVGARMNPAGVLLAAGARRRYALSPDRELAPEAAYVEGGGSLSATPAYVSPSVHAQWSPAPFFTLRCEYALLGFVGTTRGVVSFASRDARFDDAALDRSTVRRGLGHKLQVSPSLAALVGPALVLGRLDAAYYRYSGDGPAFYEIEHDTLVARGDVVLDARADIAFPLWRRGQDGALLVGPAYGLTRALRTEVQRQRVGGAIVLKTPASSGAIRRPIVFADVGIDAEDRNRGGQPFVTVGVRAEIE